VSTPAIPDVIRKNNAAVKDPAVNEYPVTPDFTTDAEGETTVNVDSEYTQFTAAEVADGEFDIMGAISAIAHGDAHFHAPDAEGQAVLDGMEHAFQAGALFAAIFSEEIEDDPALLHMGFQTYMLAQLAMAGRGE
jgi:hypothetical protein